MKNCVNCNLKLPDNAKFCNRCGRKIEDEENIIEECKSFTNDSSDVTSDKASRYNIKIFLLISVIFLVIVVFAIVIAFAIHDRSRSIAKNISFNDFLESYNKNVSHFIEEDMGFLNKISKLQREDFEFTKKELSTQLGDKCDGELKMADYIYVHNNMERADLKVYLMDDNVIYVRLVCNNYVTNCKEDFVCIIDALINTCDSTLSEKEIEEIKDNLHFLNAFSIGLNINYENIYNDIYYSMAVSSDIYNSMTCFDIISEPFLSSINDIPSDLEKDEPENINDEFKHDSNYEENTVYSPYEMFTNFESFAGYWKDFGTANPYEKVIKNAIISYMDIPGTYDVDELYVTVYSEPGPDGPSVNDNGGFYTVNLSGMGPNGQAAYGRRADLIVSSPDGLTWEVN